MTRTSLANGKKRPRAIRVSGAGATDMIVDAWGDAGAGLNREEARVSWSSSGGALVGAPDRGVATRRPSALRRARDLADR